MGKKRRDGRAASKRGNNSASSNSSNAGAQNSGGGGLLRTRFGNISYLGGPYEGELKHGMPHGKGRMKFENGDIYEGEFANGQMHGWGTMKFIYGEVYEGEWADDQPNGKGTMNYSSGEVYEGEWVAGKKHGKGTIKLPTGEIYEGNWRDGALASRPVYATGESSLPNSGASNNNATPKAGRKPFEERTLRSQRSQQRRLEVAKKTCEHCGVDDGQYKLRVCSGCNLALYCSAACQKAASRSHRRICDIVSRLPPRDADRLTLEFDREKTVDLDAGLRFATKYMGNLKHLQIDVNGMGKRDEDIAKLSPKQLSSLLSSKRGALGSFAWLSNRHGFVNDDVLKELTGLKQLRLEYMRFDEIQSLRDIIYEQKNSLEVLCLQLVDNGWSKAKTRRAVAQAVSSCKHLVVLDLQGCLLMDSDLKVMLQDLPNLRVLYLLRDTDNNHEFTENTCGLIARKCAGLQELNLSNHDQLSVRGLRKIFEGCPHLRSFHTSSLKLSCDDVRNLLDVAPQLLCLALDGGISFSAEELDDIIEATSGRTMLWSGLGVGAVYEPKEEGVSAKTRENYDRTKAALDQIWGRWGDPEVANEWDGIFEG